MKTDLGLPCFGYPTPKCRPDSQSARHYAGCRVETSLLLFTPKDCNFVKIATMITVEIPDSFLQSPSGYSIGELKVDLAVLLYKKKKMSLAQAARWCGMSRLEFQSALSEQGVEIHFTTEDLQHDLKVLDKFFSK